ncbi:PAS domain-containing protein [Rhodoblastus acidophilus]|uniref:hypothetical protein n=1 Tax=Rhodoblastus acidophilus TaxID=1074 RepID=UPI0022244B3F|nr:hypothetical protein [Rhodoblastus acidophilus]MCW2285608.1 PAS domain-containing protein [Rhodoblastus acidophilus]MCW2334634.1 PAS domain-containing protein [Rhodoblastus acidophilus]
MRPDDRLNVRVFLRTPSGIVINGPRVVRHAIPKSTQENDRSLGMRNSASGAGERAIQAVEGRYRDRLHAVPAHIAVIDREGWIKLGNSKWQAFAKENGGQADAYVGRNYLDVCRVSAPSDSYARTALEGISAVLDGSSPLFTLEYPCHSPSVQRWFRMEVDPLDFKRAVGGIVAHLDITESKMNELALRDAVESIQSDLTATRDEQRKGLGVGSVAPDVNHQRTDENILEDLIIDAHFLATRMILFARRSGFPEGIDTEFIASLLNEWAWNIGSDLFKRKNG